MAEDSTSGTPEPPRLAPGWTHNIVMNGARRSEKLRRGTLIEALVDGEKITLKRSPDGAGDRWLTIEDSFVRRKHERVRASEIEQYRLISVPVPGPGDAPKGPSGVSRPSLEIVPVDRPPVEGERIPGDRLEELEKAEAERDDLRNLLGHVHQIASGGDDYPADMGRIIALTSEYKPRCAETMPMPHTVSRDLVGPQCEREPHPIDARHRSSYVIDGTIDVKVEWTVDA